MQFQAKANVYTTSGERAGVLDRVVIDPRNRQVTHLIIQKGLLFRSDKVVPVDMVAEAEKDRVVLKEEVGDPDGLADFAEEHTCRWTTQSGRRPRQAPARHPCC